MIRVVVVVVVAVLVAALAVTVAHHSGTEPFARPLYDGH